MNDQKRKLWKNRNFFAHYSIGQEEFKEAINFQEQSEKAYEMNKHTNNSLRKLLGERGFIETPNSGRFGKNGWYKTTWTRSTVSLILHEHDKQEPYLTRGRFGAIIQNPEEELGYRNTNIQNDGSPDE